MSVDVMWVRFKEEANFGIAVAVDPKDTKDHNHFKAIRLAKMYYSMNGVESLVLIPEGAYVVGEQKSD